MPTGWTPKAGRSGSSLEMTKYKALVRARTYRLSYFCSTLGNLPFQVLVEVDERTGRAEIEIALGVDRRQGGRVEAIGEVAGRGGGCVAGVDYASLSRFACLRPGRAIQLDPYPRSRHGRGLRTSGSTAACSASWGRARSLGSLAVPHDLVRKQAVGGAVYRRIGRRGSYARCMNRGTATSEG